MPERDFKLRNSIQRMLIVDVSFLRIHAAKTTDDLKPFHDRRESMFKTMQTQVEEKYGKRRSDVTLKRSSNESVTILEGRNSPQVNERQIEGEKLSKMLRT